MLGASFPGLRAFSRFRAEHSVGWAFRFGRNDHKSAIGEFHLGDGKGPFLGVDVLTFKLYDFAFMLFQTSHSSASREGVGFSHGIRPLFRGCTATSVEGEAKRQCAKIKKDTHGWITRFIESPCNRFFESSLFVSPEDHQLLEWRSSCYLAV